METVVHIIEPQTLFVPELIDVFSEAGLSVGYVGDRIDPGRMLEDDPDLVFLDADLDPDPSSGVRTARKLAPHADIFVYTPSERGAETEFEAAGADVVIQKSVSRRELVQRLRESDRRRRIRRGC